MDPTQLRLEALKLAIEALQPAHSQSCGSGLIVSTAKVFEDYLLGPQPDTAVFQAHALGMLQDTLGGPADPTKRAR